MKLGLGDEIKIAMGGVADFASGLVEPSLRLGVTGLSRSGKTVFITALVHALVHNARLSVFNVQAQDRIVRAWLEPQAHDELPRFAYEEHIEALTSSDRRWPESTQRLSELRLAVEFRPKGFLARNFRSGRLNLDIVDYPGEWLLDLPLLARSYGEWSRSTLTASEAPPRDKLAAQWRAHLSTLDPMAPADEQAAQTAARLFTAYLASCRAEDVSLSTLPPGRFLMPGDLAGSPLLTFAPLDVPPDAEAPKGSLFQMMERRYNSYVSHVVKPFFLGHFARIDRQIILVDVLSALNAGPAAVSDLRNALTDVLAAFRVGANTWASSLFGRRIDRILFAATKADLLHRSSHDRLEDVLKLVIEEAAGRATFAGSDISVSAIAAIRATREATVKQGGEILPCIVGTPEPGERIGDEVFDGKIEAAVFPGDLPLEARRALDGSLRGKLKFVRFRPPVVPPPRPLEPAPPFPHIRLDRALEFLIGDRFP